MKIEKVLELLKTDQELQDFLANPNDKGNQLKGVESMYNFIGSEAFNEGRRSMEKEWKVFKENQDKQLESLKKIAKILNVEL